MGTIDSKKYKRLINNPKELARQIQIDFDMLDEVDPFFIAKSLGIKIMPMPLSKNLFSYATRKDDETFIFINGYNQIQRQRYNTALQTYLLIAGRPDFAYYKDHEKTPLINNAKTFAANLLLPKDKLKEEVEAHSIDGSISYDDILYIAEKFGVSFKTTAFRIFYEYNNILDIQSKDDLSTRIGEHVTFRDERKKKLPEYQRSDLRFIKQLLNSMFFVRTNNDLGFIKTIQDAIYGEIKFEERIHLNPDEIAELLAEYRLEGSIATGHEAVDPQLAQLVNGQLLAYDFIRTKQIVVPKDLPKLLHSLLFSQVDGSYNYGEYRDRDVYVQGLFKACKASRLDSKMQEIYGLIGNMYETITAHKNGEVTKSDALDQAITTMVTHYMTQPFQDGNGRTSKAMLNYFLTLLNIPGSFVVADDIMEEYRTAIAEVGNDQRTREDQLAGDYEIRVLDRKSDRIGKYDINIFGIPMVKFEDEEVVYDDELHKMEFFMPVPGEEREFVWEDLKEIDYTPMQIVIYKSIFSSYLDDKMKPKLKPTKLTRPESSKFRASSERTLKKINEIYTTKPKK